MKLITIFIISTVLFSCSSTKQNSKEKKVANSNSIEYKFDMSLHTKLFLQELEKEKNEKETENFIPSEKLIEKYSIKKINDLYTINGFIKANENFNENDLSSLNIQTNSKVGEIVTVTIPLNSIDNFLTLNGVKYFEINKKVELK